MSPSGPQETSAATSPYRFRYHVQGVGTGLFASLRLEERVKGSGRGTTPGDFVVVFDCGTLRHPQLLAAEIEFFTERVRGRGGLDVVVLSHLDRDHVNGLEQLLRNVRAEILVLPYMALGDRIELALQGAAPDPDHLALLADPAWYLQQRLGDFVGRIAYILPSEARQQTAPALQAFSPTAADSRINVQLPRPEASTNPEIVTEEETTPATPAAGRRQPLYLPSTVPWIIGTGWEMLFFNLPPKVALREFGIRASRAFRGKLFQGGRIENPEQLMDELRGIYEETLGYSPRQRNRSSLAMFFGPKDSDLVEQPFFEIHVEPFMRPADPVPIYDEWIVARP
jgi:metallo-beta-lactamase superfamily protein